MASVPPGVGSIQEQVLTLKSATVDSQLSKGKKKKSRNSVISGGNERKIREKIKTEGFFKQTKKSVKPANGPTARKSSLKCASSSPPSSVCVRGSKQTQHQCSVTQIVGVCATRRHF